MAKQVPEGLFPAGLSLMLEKTFALVLLYNQKSTLSLEARLRALVRMHF